MKDFFEIDKEELKKAYSYQVRNCIFSQVPLKKFICYTRYHTEYRLQICTCILYY